MIKKALILSIAAIIAAVVAVTGTPDGFFW